MIHCSIDPLRHGLTYTFVCRDKAGKLKWIYRAHNLVVDEGMNYHINQFYLGFPWYLGLVASGAGGAHVVFDLGDTAAKITNVFPPNPPTTNGWSEDPNYSGRQILHFANTTVPDSGEGIALSGALVFTYTGNSFFGGGFVIGSANNAGPLYSEMVSAAATPVTAGDTITATVEFDLQSPPQ